MPRKGPPTLYLLNKYSQQLHLDHFPLIFFKNLVVKANLIKILLIRVIDFIVLAITKGWTARINEIIKVMELD